MWKFPRFYSVYPVSAWKVERNYLKIKTIAHFAISVLSLLLSHYIFDITQTLCMIQKTENNQPKSNLEKEQLPLSLFGLSHRPFLIQQSSKPIDHQNFQQKRTGLLWESWPKICWHFFWVRIILRQIATTRKKHNSWKNVDLTTRRPTRGTLTFPLKAK